MPTGCTPAITIRTRSFRSDWHGSVGREGRSLAKRRIARSLSRRQIVNFETSDSQARLSLKPMLLRSTELESRGTHRDKILYCSLYRVAVPEGVAFDASPERVPSLQVHPSLNDNVLYPNVFPIGRLSTIQPAKVGRKSILSLFKRSSSTLLASPLIDAPFSSACVPLCQ